MVSIHVLRCVTVSLLFVGFAGCAEAQPGAKSSNAGEVIENSLKMRLVYVPPGEFDMGAPKWENQEKNERPHHVRLTTGFFMSAHEVTQAQFEGVLGRNPAWFSNYGKGKNDISGQDTAVFPVEDVTWFDAVEFCNALSKRERLPEYYTLRAITRENGAITSARVTENGGNGYRLPSEAQWEYACRAGSKKPYHFGNALNGREANVAGNYPYGTSDYGPFLQRTHTVGTYPPNAFGLYDMHGNVSEWCSDWLADYDGDAIDPAGPLSGTDRVLRGGGWANYASFARSASRNGSPPFNRCRSLGIRVVLPRTP